MVKMEKLEETLMILTLKLSLSKVATFVTVFFSSSFQPFPFNLNLDKHLPQTYGQKILTLTWNLEHVSNPKLDCTNKEYQRDNKDGLFLPLGQSTVLYNKVYFDFDLELRTCK